MVISGATLVNAGILFWGWRTLAPMYGNGWRVAVTAMFLLAPITLAHTRLVLSEPIFTTFVLLALWFGTRLLKSPHTLNLWLAFGVACFFMVFVRSIGFVFFAGILVYLGLALRRKFARGLLVVVVTFGVLLAPVVVLTPLKFENLIPAQYAEWLIAYGPINPLRDLATDSPGRNVTPTAKSPAPSNEGTVIDTQFIVSHIGDDLRRLLLLTGGGEREQAIAARLGNPQLVLFPGVLGLLFVIVGNVLWYLDTRRTQHVAITLFQFSTFAYLGVTLVWRGGGERLFYPVQPQLYLAFLLALGALATLCLRAFERLVRASANTITQRAPQLLALFAIAWVGLAVYRDVTLRTSYESWGDLRVRTEWIAANVPADAVILSDWPALDFLVTGRHTIQIPLRVQPAELVALLEQSRIRYIVVSTDETFHQEGIAPDRSRVPALGDKIRRLKEMGKLEHVYSNPFPLQVFRVVP